jgi:D-beta-D-heptose 7-phosphate kinase / D-beta-D-heptose 1-phosphate adenosyltransferase
MTFESERLLDRLRHVHLLVVGDVMLDAYLEGVSSRLCPEAPVPVVAVSRHAEAPGGAGNVAVNARALGARVTLLGTVGADAAGARVRQGLVERGIAAADLVVDPSRRTLAKRRIIGNAQMMLRFDEGSTEAVTGAVEEALLAALARAYHAADAVVVADYGYGVLTPRVRETIGRLQRKSPRLLLVDAKSFEAYRGLGITVAKPNYEQALRLTGWPAAAGQPRVRVITERAATLLERAGARTVVVTLDADGAVVLERGRAPHRALARPTRQARAAGAGDTFGCVFALALAAGAEGPAAADLAAAAAGVVVAKDGTAPCEIGELQDALRGPAKRAPDRTRLVEQLEAARRRGERIVLTSGCFDLLHRGHIRYLNRARELGDLLVVGLNSDDGVRRLKGSGRPINGLEDRAEVLAGLSCVDHIVGFDEDTPAELIRALRPHVFVKGGDYTRETLPEAPVVEELGGVVRILPLVEDRSTTGIIRRIRNGEAPRAVERDRELA